MIWAWLQAWLQTWVTLGGKLMLPLELHAKLVLLGLHHSLLLLLGEDALQSFDFIRDVHDEGHLRIHLSACRVLTWLGDCTDQLLRHACGDLLGRLLGLECGLGGLGLVRRLPMLGQAGKLRWLLHLLALQVVHEEGQGGGRLGALLRDVRLRVGHRLMNRLTYDATLLVGCIKSGSIRVIDIGSGLLLLLGRGGVLQVLH